MRFFSKFLKLLGIFDRPFCVRRAPLRRKVEKNLIRIPKQFQGLRKKKTRKEKKFLDSLEDPAKLTTSKGKTALPKKPPPTGRKPQALHITTYENGVRRVGTEQAPRGEKTARETQTDPERGLAPPRGKVHVSLDRAPRGAQAPPSFQDLSRLHAVDPA